MSNNDQCYIKNRVVMNRVIKRSNCNSKLYILAFPAKRQNKPPVAIIKPTNLQVKLPNSAILDGSDSTDDEKIVSYHWEEVSGPLRDQKISNDAAILSLKDLTPGNYTFK